MRLTYIYHSGFAIETDSYSVLIDYCQDTEKGAQRGFVHDKLLQRTDMLYVLSSHFHADHFNKEVLSWKNTKSNIQYIFSKDILKRRRAFAKDAFYIKKGESFDDDLLQVSAFGSTDVGVSFLLQVEDKTVFHAGDLNNWHWKDESTPQEIEEAESQYLKELDEIAATVDKIDLALFPVDPRLGTDFMRGALQFVKRMHPDVIVPMHFWERPAEIRDLKVCFEQLGCRYVLLACPGEGFEF